MKNKQFNKITRKVIKRAYKFDYNLYINIINIIDIINIINIINYI